MPPQGKLPQVFETSAELLARAEWNALRPRLATAGRHGLAGNVSGGARRLVLLLPQGSLPAGTAGLHQGPSGSLYRLDPGLPVDASVDAPRGGSHLPGRERNRIQAGELLLFVGKNGANLLHLVLRAREVEEEKTLERVRIDLDPLPDPSRRPRHPCCNGPYRSCTPSPVPTPRRRFRACPSPAAASAPPSAARPGRRANCRP